MSCVRTAISRSPGEVANIQSTHASTSHQIGHAVDHHNCIMFIRVTFERLNQTNSILAIHHVDHEDDVCLTDILRNFLPLRISQRRAEIMSSDVQVQVVNLIDLTLRIFQRTEKTGADVEDGDVHWLIVQSDSPKLPPTDPPNFC